MGSFGRVVKFRWSDLGDEAIFRLKNQLSAFLNGQEWLLRDQVLRLHG